MKKILTMILGGMATASALMAAETAAYTVTTNKSYARGATVAFGRMTVSGTGSTIKQRGFCWSETSMEPTIRDEHSYKYLSNSGAIFKMEGLTPGTRYWARPYIMFSDSTAVYGEAIKIYTLPEGTIRWGYDNGGSADENSRINAAVGGAVEYWNRLTEISDLYLNVHYGAGTPTADCSYGGWMRVGPNASYQKIGTIMHEALHAIGVGQHDLWYGSSSPLRAGSGTGQWLGDRATELLRFWDNNTTSVLNGDGTHLWPYGINGAHEDSGTEVLYTITSLLAQAVGEDGLPPTTSNPAGLPYYSFAQEDTIKYYIKNESESYGMQNSFLVASAGTFKWVAMTAEAAAANDAAAWYITFTPSNQYYQIRNASTGAYLTVGSEKNIQLMRSRCGVTNASGVEISSERGYWMVAAKSATCLLANANGAIGTGTLNLANNQQRQRWLILTSKQASAVANVALVSARSQFLTMRNQIQTLIETPHTDVVEGATDDMVAKLTKMTAQAEVAESASEINTLNTNLLQAAKAFLPKTQVADPANPYDLTFMLTNPNFATGKEGWTGTIATTAAYSATGKNVEFYEKPTISVAQTLSDMPLGVYRLKAHGFMRPGTTDNTYADYTAGKDKSTCRLFVGDTSKGAVTLKNLMAERSATKINSDDKQVADKTYVPFSMTGAAAYFKAGYYDNTTEYLVPTAGNLRVGLIATSLPEGGSAYWTIFSDFRLYYIGPKPFEVGIRSVEQERDEQTPCYYNLQGQQLTRPTDGINLVNGKKIIFKR